MPKKNMVRLNRYTRTKQHNITVVPAQCARQFRMLMNAEGIEHRAWPFEVVRRMDDPPMTPMAAIEALSAFDEAGVVAAAPTVFEVPYDQETVVRISQAIRQSDAWLDEMTNGIVPEDRRLVMIHELSLPNDERDRIVLDMRRQIMAQIQGDGS